MFRLRIDLCCLFVFKVDKWIRFGDLLLLVHGQERELAEAERERERGPCYDCT